MPLETTTNLVAEPPASHSAAPEDTRTLHGSWIHNLALTLPFLLLFWVDLAHHEMWLDELNAWGLSAASPTLGALFANVHYEGHPWLWYFLLWVPAHFTHSAVAMKWVEALIGTAIYLVIGMLSPFTRTQKVLVLLNYFVIFEYTVISRTYAPMLLLTFLYTWRRSAKPEAVFGNLLLLGALANTDLAGIMISGALLLEYAAYFWIRRLPIDTKRTAFSILAYLALLGFSVHTLTLAKDISWATTGHLFAEAGSFTHFVHALANVTVATWWPIATGYPHQFWNNDAAFHRSAMLYIPVVLASLYWTFRKQRNLLVLVGSCLLLALCFAHLVYIGHVRHWGITVVGFLIATWILCAETPGKKTLPRVGYLLLAIGSLKGLAAVAASWTHPFSENGNVAAWIRANHYDNEPLVGSPDYNLAGVAEQLQRPAFFLNCNCVDTYMKFAHRRDGMTPEEVPDRIANAYKVLGVHKIVLVMENPLSSDDLRRLAETGLLMRPLASFTGSEDHMNLHLYEAARSPSQ